MLAGAAPATPITSSFAPLMGMRDTITALAQVVPNAVANGMLLILVFALLRVVFRRTWLAVTVTATLLIGVVALQLLPSPRGWTQLPLAMAAVAVIFIVVVRFRLLATVVMFYVGTILEVIPLTADPSMRYFTTSLWIIGAITALALFAAHAARAGQPLFMASSLPNQPSTRPRL